MSLPALPPLPETEWKLHMPACQYESEWTSSEYGYTSDQMLEYANQYAALAVAAAVPPGYAVVPIEPTEKMLQAAVKSANGDAVYRCVKAEALKIEEEIHAETWKAMVAAAQEQKI